VHTPQNIRPKLRDERSELTSDDETAQSGLVSDDEQKMEQSLSLIQSDGHKIQMTDFRAASPAPYFASIPLAETIRLEKVRDALFFSFYFFLLFLVV